MIIKTSQGIISAPEHVLNVLSIGYGNLAKEYEKLGCPFSANTNREVSNEIFLALDEAGFYDYKKEEVS